MTINERKQALRKQVAALKRAHSPEVLAERSREALRRLESTELFQAAACFTTRCPARCRRLTA